MVIEERAVCVTVIVSLLTGFNVTWTKKEHTCGLANVLSLNVSYPFAIFRGDKKLHVLTHDQL